MHTCPLPLNYLAAVADVAAGNVLRVCSVLFAVAVALVDVVVVAMHVAHPL